MNTRRNTHLRRNGAASATPVLAVILSLVSCAPSEPTTSPDAADSEARAGADVEPTSIDASKMRANLGLRFEEPTVAIAADTPIPVAIEIEGRPDETVRVRFSATKGVDLSAADETRELTLDAAGRGRASITVRLPRPSGCFVIAHVTNAAGVTREAHCQLGGEATEEVSAEAQGTVELDDGRRIRVDPSK